jgi:hypothetical protein
VNGWMIAALTPEVNAELKKNSRERWANQSFELVFSHLSLLIIIL